MQKKHIKIAIITALAIIAGAAVLFFILHSGSPGTFTGEIPAGVSNSQATTATLSKNDLQLAVQSTDKAQDTPIRTALLEEYDKAQISRHGDTVLFDLTTGNKQRIVISISDDGKTVHKYLWEEKLLLVNENNKTMQVIEDDFQRNVANAELPQLDPFKDNPACLDAFEKKETNREKFAGLFESAGYPGEQTVRAYESQNRFEATQTRGTVFPAGVSLPSIALTQKLSMQTLLDMIKKCEIELDINDLLPTDTLFVTFKRQNFHHERNVTVTNPLPRYKNAETLIYSIYDSGIVEVSYRTPQLVNTAKDIVSSNIMSKPNSMEDCDGVYTDRARKSLSSKLYEDKPEFVLWAEYKPGDVS